MKKTVKRKISIGGIWAIASAAVLVLCLCAAFVYTSLFPMIQTSAGQTVLHYAQENNLFYWEYPKSLISLLERNPETKKFVLEYPSAKNQAYEIDLSEYSRDSVPLFLQWDQRWGYLRYGSDVAGLTGCGPVCLSMVGYYLTGSADFSPDRMLRFASDNGYYVSGSGSSWTLISEGGQKLGLDVTELPLDENRIRINLEKGIPIICAMGPGDFTTTGHFIVLTGWENGKIRINDPNSIENSEALWTYAQISGQIRNLWALQNPS